MKDLIKKIMQVMLVCIILLPILLPEMTFSSDVRPLEDDNREVMTTFYEPEDVSEAPAVLENENELSNVNESEENVASQSVETEATVQSVEATAVEELTTDIDASEKNESANPKLEYRDGVFYWTGDMNEHDEYVPVDEHGNGSGISAFNWTTDNEMVGNITIIGSVNTNGWNRTGNIVVPAGATLIINSGSGGESTITGTITVNNGGTLIQESGTITGEGSRGVTVTGANATFTMNGGYITGNSNVVNGAGVLVQTGATFTMTGGIISNNRALRTSPTSDGGGGNGGGVMIENNSTFTMTGGLIDNNFAVNNGGGIAVGMGTPIILIDGLNARISNNEALRGGGIGVAATGTRNGQITLTNGSIDNNRALNNPYYVVWNVAHGGGVNLLGNVTFTMNGGYIDDNFSQNNGGGFYMLGNSRLVITNGEITNNVAGFDIAGTERNGGGIGSGGTGVGIHMTGGLIAHNRAGSNGGGVSITGAGANAPGLLVEGGYIYDNEAWGQGGGIDVAGANGRVTLQGNAVITENRAFRGAGFNSPTHGGGVAVRTGSTLTMRDQAVITKNLARIGGGGVRVSGGSTFVMYNGLIDNNETQQTSVGEVHGGGGVSIADVGSTFTMHAGEITNNLSNLRGGGIHIRVGGSATINGGIIARNSAGLVNGGGIEIADANSSLTINNVLLDNNWTTAANTNGGGIHITNGTVNLNGGSITNNRAVSNGGGIHLANGTLNLGSTSPININNNSAQGAGNGGGIAWFGGVISTNNSGNTVQVNNNNAAHGGGIHIQANNATLAVTEGFEIRDNTARVQGGGINAGTATNNTTVNINNGTIVENNAVTGAGVAINGNGNLNLNSGSISTNIASGNGGGVMVNNNATFTINNGQVIGNTAYATVSPTALNNGGGGIFVTQNGTLNATGGSITNNRAPNGDGGGVFSVRHNYSDVLVATDYNNLTIDASVTMTGNSAVVSAICPPYNPQVLTHIRNNRDNSLSMHVLNNYDVNYRNACFEFIKTDDAGEPLAGATFRLERRNAAGAWETMGTVTSPATGLVRFGGLSRGGQYRLTETAAPTGFVTPEGYWTITVHETAPRETAITITPSSPDQPAFERRPVCHEEVCEYTWFLENERLTVDFEFTKVSSVAGNPVLEGAEFVLFSRNSAGDGWETTPRPPGTIVSDADGLVSFVGLRHGSQYRLEETEAPVGFVAPGGYWIIDVSLSGVITIEARNGAPAFMLANGSTVTNVDKDTENIYLANEPEERDFIFIKTDETLYDYQNTDIADVTRLPGARFRLERYIPNTEEPNEPGSWYLVGEATSAANGVVQFESAVTAHTLYRLTEIEAPTGFILPQGHWYFRFNEDGTVQRSENYPLASGGWVLAFRYVEDYTEGGGMWFVGNMFDIELPSTGGSGTMKLLILGTLTLGAVYLLWLRKKVKHQFKSSQT